ncbi:hypothetical protein Cni_G06368 [Canna indica]|uniref:Uncharacterized protein n=1 Tax=Canna indica TaxID=4628 RepID=A0AAQ3Q5V7_9LILI|nr:hypothetical protein Cni_G06368 [Canna indica]
MEVVVPVPLAVVSAPSSPRPFGNPADYYFYTSAPTSPARIAAIYNSWEDKLASEEPADEASDFSFSFHGQPEGGWTLPVLVPADDLFVGGVIRPSLPSSAERSNFSSATTMKDAMNRGRTLSHSSSSSMAFSRGWRGTRSVSPLRGEDDLQKSLSSTASSISTFCKRIESKKWKLKDLFLFRSASEGRATARGSKDPLRKHTFLPSSSSSSLNKRADDDVCGAAPGILSAHEMYYSANRAASKKMQKKTPLPYNRHGLFGYLRYNPAIHSITKGFGGSFFSRRQL